MQVRNGHSLAALVLLCSAACSDAENGDAAAPVASDWSYEGLANPASSDLDSSAAECGDVGNASPIDLPARMAVQDVPDVTFNYSTSALHVINNGHTLQWNHEPGSEIRVADDAYPLVQFHFHAHSEHAVNGRHAPLELHLVHRNQAGRTVVAAIFFEVGVENGALESLGWSRLPASGGVELHDTSAHFDVSELLTGGDSYRYTGSLTTPPCTAQVDWIVFSRSATISKEQLESFTSLYDDNARPLVEQGDRDVDFGS